MATQGLREAEREYILASVELLMVERLLHSEKRLVLSRVARARYDGEQAAFDMVIALLKGGNVMGVEL